MSDKKQLTVLKTKTTKVVNRANDLSVTNQEEFDQAANILSDMKAVAKAVKEDREKITKPMNTALEEVRDRYRPFEKELKEAEGIVKEKLSDYQKEVQAKLDAEEAELRKKMAAGEIKPEEAVEQIENKESIGSSYSTKRGAVQFKKVKKVRVTDITKVPVQYLNDPKVIDALTSVVRKEVLSGTVIAGVEVYEDQQVAA